MSKRDKSVVTRRKALWAFGVSLCAPSLLLSGCAVSPVTGEKILVGMGEKEELELDRTLAPHQFSKDLGAVQDQRLNSYVTSIGVALHQGSHRKSMPYNYRVVNANYLNAYTFPAGSMALTRGIMIELQNEAELAAVLGHELGHVNARHSAQKQGQALLAAVALATVEVAARDSKNKELVGIGSQLGASALLAGYSREFEREADGLGQEYLVRGGYPASAMVALHQMLLRTDKSRPGLLETMFSSHPMSQERVRLSQGLADTKYAATRSSPVHRERFMDNTATLQALRPTIEDNRNAELAMSKGDMGSAAGFLRSALKRSPRDYPTHFRMAQVHHSAGELNDALRFAQASQSLYPQEAQAHKLVGVLYLERGNPGAALESFQRYDQYLSNDVGVMFLKGMSYETLGDRSNASKSFQSYLNSGGSGDGANYARDRLKRWGSSQAPPPPNRVKDQKGSSGF